MPQPGTVAGSPARAARPVAPQRPEDATTMEELMAGWKAASLRHQIQLVTPRFLSTAGPWMRLGEHEIRLPPDIIFSTQRSDGGEHVCVIAYLDSSAEAGRVQVLVTRPRGILEMTGLWPEQLRQLREEFLGR